MDSEFTLPLFSLRLRWLGRGRLVAFADIELNDLEVFHVSDVTVGISIYTLEDEWGNIWRTNNSQKLIGLVNESVELF